MDNRFKGRFKIKIAFMIIAAILVMGTGTMLLWNWLIPSLFHGPALTFLEALGLLALSKILFGGFGGRRGGWNRGGGGPQMWKEKMRERMANMSPEDRAQFSRRMEGRCGRRSESQPVPDDRTV